MTDNGISSDGTIFVRRLVSTRFNTVQIRRMAGRDSSTARIKQAIATPAITRAQKTTSLA